MHHMAMTMKATVNDQDGQENKTEKKSKVACALQNLFSRFKPRVSSEATAVIETHQISPDTKEPEEQNLTDSSSTLSSSEFVSFGSISSLNDIKDIEYIVEQASNSSSDSSIYFFDSFVASKGSVNTNKQLCHVDRLAVEFALCRIEESNVLTQADILEVIRCINELPNSEKSTDSDDEEAKSTEKPLHIQFMGLPNIGNTCFMNSTLQCLLSLKPFMTDIAAQQEHRNGLPAEKMLSASLYDLNVARQSNTTEKDMAQILERIKDCIAQKHKDFGGNNQQDAHEFLIICLAQLEAETEGCQQPGICFSNPAAHMEFTIDRLRTCTACWNQTSHTERLNCLSLAIGPQRSLLESLQLYFASSTLECYCNICDCNYFATETVQFLTFPRILILLVMRFDFTMKKIKGHMAIPEELNLFSFADTTESTTYKLSGVVSHYGSNLHFGHYISNIRDPIGAEWLKCNDDTVNPISWTKASKIIEKHGYILFYERK